MMSGRTLKKLIVGVAIAASIFIVGSRDTTALSGSEFNAGRIIDDSVFFNSNSMSVVEIQNFLNSKVDCDFDGSEMTGGITRAQYAAQRGYPTTFTCLPQYKENPTTHENNIGSPNSTPAGAISAAQIIYNASSTYGVSSKTLIVLLQKEQGLLTDEWPVPNQYRSATGYGCPDTAPCDSQYYGFYNQVSKAAYQFKRYVDNPLAYRYKSGQANSVYWSPTTSCGSSNVFIENGATAALYNYTPYRPNQAALDNLYGTGDSCSAYGNRNFWRYFRDWFGTTNSPNYAWQYLYQNVYTASDKRVKVDSYSNNLLPQSEYYFELGVKNTGNSTWYQGQMWLGTNAPTDRASQLAHPSWRTASRPATLVQSQVAPGQVGTFEFTVSTPGRKFFNREHFNLVQEGVTWLNDPGAHWVVGTDDPNYAWEFKSQYVYPNSSRTNPINSYTQKLAPNTTYYVVVEAKNVSNYVWRRNVFRLAASRPTDRYSVVMDSSWLSPGRATNMKEDYVRPGEIASFEFTIKTPADPVSLKEYFNIVHEGKAWLNDLGMHFVINT